MKIMNYFLTNKGFLPNKCCAFLPLKFKQSSSFIGFENIVDSLTKSVAINISPHEYRKLIDNVNKNIVELPILDDLTIEEVRYLYVFATFASLKYVWCQGVDNCPERLPNFLARLWKSTGDVIGLKTTITYAGSVLYNWKFHCEITDHDDLQMEDIECIFSFTKTIDEDNFFKIMVIIEQYCGPIINNYMEIHGLCVLPPDLRSGEMEDYEAKVIRINECLQNINQNMIKIYNTLFMFGRKYKCDPSFFYNTLRKYLCGFNDTTIFPKGFIIGDKHRSYPGSSGAQSPLFFFLDTILNINHADNHGNHIKKMMDKAFVCMPTYHQNYISSLKDKLDLDYIIKTCYNEQLTHSYNQIIKNYNRIRSCHYAIVHKYIIKQNPKAIKGTLGSDLKKFLTTIIKNTKNKIDNRFEKLEKHSTCEYVKVSIILLLLIIIVILALLQNL
jgi:hypothetical protein